MRSLTRRDFARSVAVAGISGAAARKVLGSNDRIKVAVIGIRGRGGSLAEYFAERNDVNLAYLCDVDTRLFESRTATVEKAGGARPECVQDFRRVLDDTELDAVAIATPDHWHALATIWACQAGKDVFVEKPTSHSIWESRKMIEAARKYDRIVQVGTQSRSGEYCRLALDYIKSGELGDVHFVRVLNSKERQSIGEKPVTKVPEGVDYDMWLGPAPMRPFNENHFHYSWHWFWAYSGGDIINDGVHQIDLARWLSGVTLPTSVSSTGGIHFFEDDQETPDTHVVNWDFPGMTMVFEQTLWTPYMKKTPIAFRDTDNLPLWPFSGTRIELYGTRQQMLLSRHGGGWEAFEPDGKSVRIQPGRFTNREHVENFISCVRSRKRPVADIEEGHRSTLLCHYGNIAYRCGRKLRIDPETEGFIDDAEANGYTRRIYRDPWTVPEAV
ncbi:MAG: Gfo/Idh/MocA family oxidoreductase [Acidobacteriota bacterium]|nr:MAG: Gfo/Idh/MocA family oxidoreductase [Acidobacteriota bacterium]